MATGTTPPPTSAKRPRGRGQTRAAVVLETTEDGIYVVVAAILVLSGAFLLWSTIAVMYKDISGHADPLKTVFDVLDQGLVLLIIGELLHTVRVSLMERTLAAEPFLVVAIIAGIRRILIITAQAAQGSAPFRWSSQGLELLLLTGLVLVMTVAVILWRRFYIPLLSPDE